MANGFGNQPQESRQGLRQRWGNWLSDGGNRAALIQFGLSMTQPLGFGENFLSKVGSSVGEAGQAKARYQEQEQEVAKTEEAKRLAGEKLDIQKQNAQSNRIRALAIQKRAGQGLSLTQTIRNQRADQKAFREWVTDKADLEGFDLNLALSDPEQRNKLLREWSTIQSAASAATGGSSSTGSGTPPIDIPEGYTYAGEKGGVHYLLNTNDGKYYRVQ